MKYICPKCALLSETKNEYPICPICKEKLYGFKYNIKSIINGIFNFKTLKLVLLFLFIIINTGIWTLGVIKITEIVMKG